jgi:hypothetical protein
MKAEATDGNLGAQLLKLEDAGYVRVKNKFVLCEPQSSYRIADADRQALAEYAGTESCWARRPTNRSEREVHFVSG